MHTLSDLLIKCGCGSAFIIAVVFAMLWIGGELRVQLLWVWRDLWVGVFVSEKGVTYICLLPTVVIKITPTRRP